MKKYLFVCQHNFTRSKFGAEFFRGYLNGKKINAKVRSVGLGFSSNFFGNRVCRESLNGVDWVFVMENYMKDYLFEKFGVDKKKIVVIGIKDEYGFMKKKNILELDRALRRVKWERYLK